MLRTLAALTIDALLFTGLAEAVLHLLAGAGGGMPVLEARSSFLGALGTLPPLACIALLVVAQGLPVGRLLLVASGSLWLSYGAAPVFLHVPEGMPVAYVWGALRLGFLALLFRWIVSRARKPFLLSTDLPDVAPRSGLGLLACLGLTVLAFPALVGGYGVFALLCWLELATRGFVSFDLAGVSLADRRYVQESREVRLVGMMHVGERERYRELVKSFVVPGTVVLTEGVTDREGLLGSDLDYGGAATALGLESQDELENYLLEIDPAEVGGTSPLEWPVLRHADLDVSDFALETRSFVEQAGTLWASASLSESFRDYLRWFESQDGAVLVERVYRDLIELRNAHLLEELEEAQHEYALAVVPWGALHLPGIERELLARGFELVEGRNRRLIHWQTLLER